MAASWLSPAADAQNPSIGASRASLPMVWSRAGKVKKSRSAWVSFGMPSTTNVPSRYMPVSPVAIEVAASCQVRPREFSCWYGSRVSFHVVKTFLTSALSHFSLPWHSAMWKS